MSQRPRQWSSCTTPGAFKRQTRDWPNLRGPIPGEPHTLYAEGYARFLSGDYPAAVAKLKLADAGMPVKDLLLLAEGAQKSIEGHQNGARPIS
jgi:hypothetical protein